MKITKATSTLGLMHGISALVFGLHCLQGPPMGESCIDPWDYGAAISGLMTMIVCPVAWIGVAIFRRRKRIVEPKR